MNKYSNKIEKIQASEELKERIKLNMKAELEKNTIEKNKTKKKGGLKSKLIPIIGTITTLACGGVAFAGLTGHLNIFKPDNAEYGVSFSDNYHEYEVLVENQYIEDNGNKVELVSTVADDGFLIMKFNVKLNEKYLDEPFIGISFNDKAYEEKNGKIIPKDDVSQMWLGGANYNITIDNENYFVRPGSIYTINEIGKNEYDFYQMWFLSKDILDEKEEFKVTLDDVIISVGEEMIKLPGKFEVDISKEKAKNNCRKFYVEDEVIKYKTASIFIDEVNITPLQNIIQVTTSIDHATEENVTNMLNENCLGMINYLAYDQNENLIERYSVETHREIVYSDGTVEVLGNGDYEFSRKNDEGASLVITEYIAVEQRDDINKIILDLVETFDHTEECTKIGSFEIDLETQDIKASNEKTTYANFIDLYELRRMELYEDEDSLGENPINTEEPTNEIVGTESILTEE